MFNDHHLQPPQNFHFIAICGTAMASVAVNLVKQGYTVTGSDNHVYPPMSDFLVANRIPVAEGFSPDNLPEDGLIVIGNAVSRGNPELESALNRNMNLISLPELINRYYLTGKQSLVVTGTHGKTTTTSMAAFILDRSGRKPGWLIGGLPLDLDAPCQYGQGSEFIIEGDEYDSAWFDKRPKFLHYKPRYAVITGIEFDHGDIYRNLSAIESAFCRFVGLIPENGRIIANGDDAVVRRVIADAHCPVITYGNREENDWRLAPGDSLSNTKSSVRILKHGHDQFELRLLVPGEHNALNATAAIALTHESGITTNDALKVIAGFRGVKRRFQLVTNRNSFHLYDDFAHHPSAIRAALETARNQHHQSRLWAILEPRSNTMVRNHLQDDLVSALRIADRVILGTLHRKERIPVSERLNRNLIVEKLKEYGIPGHAAKSNLDITGFLKDRLIPGDVLVVMSNGKFDDLVERVNQLIVDGYKQRV